MAPSDPKPLPKVSPLLHRSDLSRADRVKLLTELASPYRGLRRFIYLAVGSSATLGAFVFFFRALAGQDLSSTLPSLALQLGILAGMIGLNHLENRSRERLVGRVEQRLGLQDPQESDQAVADNPPDR